MILYTDTQNSLNKASGETFNGNGDNSTNFRKKSPEELQIKRGEIAGWLYPTNSRHQHLNQEFGNEMLIEFCNENNLNINEELPKISKIVDEIKRTNKNAGPVIDPHETYYIQLTKDFQDEKEGKIFQVLGTEYMNYAINDCVKEITKEDFEKIGKENYTKEKKRIDEMVPEPNEEVLKVEDDEEETFGELNGLKDSLNKLVEENDLETGEEIKEFLDKVDVDLLPRETPEDVKFISNIMTLRNDWNTLRGTMGYSFREGKEGGPEKGEKINKETSEALKELKEEAGIEEVLSPSQTTIFRQLAKDFYENQPYFYDSAKVWWIWNKKRFCWESKDEVDLFNEFDKYFIQETEKSNIKSGILEALKKYGRSKKPKDIKPTWIQFKDKVYDIENNGVFEPTPEHFIANPIPWKVGGSEDTPLINSLFSSWVEEKDIPMLYELMAYTCVPEMFIHSFIFLFGVPGTGKGTYVNTLLNFIGRNNTVSTSLSRMNANPRFETNFWHKKLLITMSEVSNVNDLKNSGLINQATGGDPLRAEVKGGGGFDFVNYGKFIYPTNKLLKVDSMDGFGRRVRILKFNTRFEKEKDVLKEIPDVEYENLAKKCLRVAKELYQHRRFTGDVNISKRMSDYQEESKSPLEKFINSNCDVTQFEAEISFDEFYAKYYRVLISGKQRPETKPNVRKELKKIGYEAVRENRKIEETNSLGSFSKWGKKSIIYGLKLKILDSLDTLPVKSHLDSHIENRVKTRVGSDTSDQVKDNLDIEYINMTKKEVENNGI